MEEVDKFIGRQPDVVEKDACGKRTEEYEGELKKELSEIAKRERPASGNCPPVVIIATRSDGELSFTQEESSIAFHIPENTLETLLTSTVSSSHNFHTNLVFSTEILTYCFSSFYP